jgi:hypothetical protein
MQTIQFIQHTQKQLQSKTTLEATHQLDKSCKIKKGKKMVGVIISIFHKLTVIVRIIAPDLLDYYHYVTIYYSVCLLCVLANTYIKFNKTKNP